MLDSERNPLLLLAQSFPLIDKEQARRSDQQNVNEMDRIVNTEILFVQRASIIINDD